MDTPSIPDTIGEILLGNECGTRIHTEKQPFSFFLFVTVEWKLYLAPVGKSVIACLSTCYFTLTFH